MKRVKYICFYDKLDSNFKRRIILSATTKIDYIVSVLNRLNIGVDIISAAYAEGGQFSFDRTKTISNGINTLTTFGAFSVKSHRITQKLNRGITKKKFLKYLEKHIHEGEDVIVYHSPFYANEISLLRKKIKFNLIGEIEEIYQDVRKMGNAFDQAEYSFFKSCDKYIVPTQLLDKRINESGKKSIVIHGLYNVQEDKGLRFGDGKIHIVYAGTFDPQKGGAFAAIGATEFLPSNYHIHIIGFGSKSQIEAVKNSVTIVSEKSEASITYDGLLKGNDFVEFMQKCDIGLSTQNPNAAFNATSFPSKILNYLSNGLKVVTIDIPVVKESGIGDFMYYYHDQTPKEIAQAITSAVKSDKYNGREILTQLDEKFVVEFNQFID